MTYIKDGRLVVNTNIVTGALNGHQTPTGLYEIIPGFLCGLIAAVVVSLCSKAPSKEVTDLFDRAFEPTD